MSQTARIYAPTLCGAIPPTRVTSTRAEKIAEWQGKPVGDWLPCAAAPLRSTARGLPRLHTEPRGTGEEASQAGLPCRRALDSYNAGSALILLACLSAQRKGVFSSSHVAGRNILVTHPVSLLGRVPRQPMVHRTPRGWRRSYPLPVRLRVISLGGEQGCALDWRRHALTALLRVTKRRVWQQIIGIRLWRLLASVFALLARRAGQRVHQEGTRIGSGATEIQRRAAWKPPLGR